MTQVSVRILGTSPARPYSDSHTSAIHVSCGGTRVLVDCGEGILAQLSRFGLSEAKLDAVCITHLHGDHVYGLPGLLTSLALQGRTRELHLVGPPSLETLVRKTLEFSHAHLTYPLAHHKVSMSAAAPSSVELRDLIIGTIPLQHRVPAVGFSISTRDHGRRIQAEALGKFNIPYSEIAALRAGDDYITSTGEVISNLSLTTDPTPQRSVCYLTDTQPMDTYPAGFPVPTLLLHDSTFSREDEALALKTGHSTIAQAAAFAKTARAKRLLLTHISPRYKVDEKLLAEAKSLFPFVELAHEGAEYRC